MTVFQVIAMKKILLLYYLVFTFSYCFSQGISVDATYNANSLVNLLTNNPCFTVSNVNMSTGESVGYFNDNSSTFPLTEGVLIRNGQASLTAGQYTGNNLSSTLNTNSDSYLQNLSTQSSGQTTALVDIAFLEFDFTTSYNHFNFDFVFASNEYGEFQCISNDIFAFALTDLVSGTTTNLAIVPGTSFPVTVKNIRDTAYNTTCNSANSGFFGTYNVTNPTASTINMRGHTIPLSAEATVLPDHPYRIRFSIGDYGDSDYDSAVFIGSGSFTTDFDLGEDQVFCFNDSLSLDTQLDNSYNFQWYQNNNALNGETNPTYTVTMPGTYTVIINKGDCQIEDSITFTQLTVIPPESITVCDSTLSLESFDLLVNNGETLGINETLYQVYYFASLADANANNPIPNSELSNFQSAGQTIYIKIFSLITNQFCSTVYPVDLIVKPIIAGTVDDIIICNTLSGVFYPLSSSEFYFINLAVNGGSPEDYTVTYYTNENDAIAGTNNITSTVTIPAGVTSASYWVRVENIDNGDCFGITSINISLFLPPIVDSIDNIYACDSATLPPITNGFYFSEPGGTGINLGQGGNTSPQITAGGNYYIFNGPDENGCSSQSSFVIVLIEDYEINSDACGSFSIPVAPADIGDFYTLPGGPNGGGTLIPPGTTYTNTTTSTIMQTVYYYAEMDGEVCKDSQFDVYIHPVPDVEVTSDVVSCGVYTLPPLTNANYFYENEIFGFIAYNEDTVSTSGNFFIQYYTEHIDSQGNESECSVIGNIFEIIILDLEFLNDIPSTVCGSYLLPEIEVGGYYDAPAGQGNLLDPTIPITSSQTIYYYVPTTVTPNCTDNLNFNILIFPAPLVDTLPGGNYCGEYILPPLTNGSYYMLSGGPDIANQVAIPFYTAINLTGTSFPPGTYYIFNGPDENGCTNESSFTITIDGPLETDAVINSIVCDPYSIPQPVNGTIYTSFGGPNGTGTIVSPNEVFTEDNTFFIYNESPTSSCIVDNVFTVFFNGINLPDYPDIFTCIENDYQLPTLTHEPPESTTDYSIGYFYNANGVNPIPTGTIFNTVGTTTIYVYAVNNGRFGITCIEEDSFILTVSETPELPSFAMYNSDYCSTFTLPELPDDDYTVNYYWQSGGNDADLIDNSEYTFSIQSNDSPETYNIWVYAEAINNPYCFDEEHFQFTIYPPRQLIIPDGVICVDPNTSELLQSYLMHSGLNPNTHTIEWFYNGDLIATGINYNAIQAGIYTAVPIMLIPENAPNCNYETIDIEVQQSSSAIASVVVTLPFEDIATATAIIEKGFGEYLFALDGGAFQNSATFENLSSGEHFITIKDVLGNCGETVVDFTVVKYPKFFTPNGDNINDSWNIWDLRKDYPNAVISIFDRYGKFLKQFSPTDPGWDGTYNGEQLPSTDYWFTVDFNYYGNEKQFKAHFSMKR